MTTNLIEIIKSIWIDNLEKKEPEDEQSKRNNRT